MKRIIDLFEKLISIKGLFFILCLVLTFLGHLDGEYFFYSGIIVIGDRTLEKWIRGKNGC